ncbi:hypothetical protein L596_026182 [Steinernema carpocapsae]|uniref:dTMP kinase n=1 Tax=Steinernema carpocapsae TaxID=34508 RepID=A0A4U5M0L4_STECR|nr:hypothetical protein L596_026182 [Steinernema carpocapsae]
MVELAAGDAQKRRGALIVFEGLDRSGKSTQAQKINEKLNKKGIKSEYCSFPDRSPETRTGPTIQKHLEEAGSPLDKKEEIHLIFSQNRWERIGKLEEKLQNGTTIILDRYVASGASYTMAKGLPKSFACAVDVGLPRPDYVVYLDVSHEVITKRKGFGDEKFEVPKFQADVRKAMEEFREHSTWKTINADQSMEAVENDVEKLVFDLVEADRPEQLDVIEPGYFGAARKDEDFEPKDFPMDVATRGLLLAFQGPDAKVRAEETGEEEFAEGCKVEIMDMTAGNGVTDDLTPREKALQAAAHFWNQHENVLKHLAEGSIVVLLNYVPSLIQETNNNVADKTWAEALSYGLPVPDKSVDWQSIEDLDELIKRKEDFNKDCARLLEHREDLLGTVKRYVPKK